MSKINDGGAAFPRPASALPNQHYSWDQDGLSKRELFAAMAMQGMLANPTMNPQGQANAWIPETAADLARMLSKVLDEEREREIHDRALAGKGRILMFSATHKATPQVVWLFRSLALAMAHIFTRGVLRIGRYGGWRSHEGVADNNPGLEAAPTNTKTHTSDGALRLHRGGRSSACRPPGLVC